MNIYYVRYSGEFGFLKPANAVRDESVYSESFLTPSNIEGIRLYMGVSSIDRVKLYHNGFALMMERVRGPVSYARAMRIVKPKKNIRIINKSIAKKYYMVRPTVIFGFYNEQDAKIAEKTSFSLGSSECIVLPMHRYWTSSVEEFNEFPGAEFVEAVDGDMYVGWNRFTNSHMIGTVQYTVGSGENEYIS